MVPSLVVCVGSTCAHEPNDSVRRHGQRGFRRECGGHARRVEARRASETMNDVAESSIEPVEEEHCTLVGGVKRWRLTRLPLQQSTGLCELAVHHIAIINWYGGAFQTGPACPLCGLHCPHHRLALLVRTTTTLWHIAAQGTKS
jgi:hypothetical protein